MHRPHKANEKDKPFLLIALFKIVKTADLAGGLDAVLQ